MIKLGEINTLEILRETDHGVYLVDDEDNQVLLPNRYVPEGFKIWEKLDVFVYLDNEERPVATTDMPYIKRGEFSLLRCNQVTDYGAFLDWGLVKELFCPFSEQAFKMKPGGWYLVHCYLDEKTNRLVASSKTNRFLDNKELSVKEFDEVDLSVGDKIKGIVKKIRPGNKLDIALGQVGYRNIEPNADKIIKELQDNGGYLNLTDKSSPEAIKDSLQMSKKNFKKAVGTLYKKRLIEIKPDGIYLVE